MHKDAECAMPTRSDSFKIVCRQCALMVGSLRLAHPTNSRLLPFRRRQLRHLAQRGVDAALPAAARPAEMGFDIIIEHDLDDLQDFVPAPLRLTALLRRCVFMPHLARAA